jgi:hypothetical protein
MLDYARPWITFRAMTGSVSGRWEQPAKDIPLDAWMSEAVEIHSPQELMDIMAEASPMVQGASW